MPNITKQQLIDFEKSIQLLWESGELKCLKHFCGGNEDILIEYFKCVKEDDYVFSTWRSAYHFLLKTGDFEYLYDQIVNKNNSMHINDVSRRFYSSAIVGGTVAIACGVALGIKLRGGNEKVHVFCGDGCLDEGFFWEALRYSQGQDLNIVFVVENNNRSVCTTIKDRWGNKDNWVENLNNKEKIYYYEYSSVHPHCGSGKFVRFL